MGSNKNKQVNHHCTCCKTSNRNSKQSANRSHVPSSTYKCRVCHSSHPLKNCPKFLGMNIAKRLEAVSKHRYCVNCLAHDHAKGSCDSKGRCHHCRKSHHTLVHVNSRLQKELLPGKSRDSSTSKVQKPTPAVRSSSSVSKGSTGKKPILANLVRSNEVILLPTVCVTIDMPDKKQYTARCLLNTGTPHSKIQGTLVEKMDFQRYCLDTETLCRLKLQSVYDEASYIEHTFRVGDIQIRTPLESVPPSIKLHYRNLALADSNFHLSDEVDIILGMDVHKKVVIPGEISKPGLPDATNTIFGYSINGTYAS